MKTVITKMSVKKGAVLHVTFFEGDISQTEVVLCNNFTHEVSVHHLPMTQGQLLAWMNGTRIQYAFPNLSPDQRELLMTGLTDAQWNELTNEED